MPWSFRKSFNFGPFRVNAGRTGIGWSVGTGPFRTGVSAGGRTYSSARIPGTGLTWRGSLLSLGCILVAAVLLLAAAGVGLYLYFFR